MIEAFIYAIPPSLKGMCKDCWELPATHWGRCGGCYWKSLDEIAKEEFCSVWDKDI